jgi:hypothetical protein
MGEPTPSPPTDAPAMDPLFKVFLHAKDWKWSKRGNEYRDYKGYNVVVYQSKIGQWMARVVGQMLIMCFLDHARRAMRPSGWHFSTCED